MVDGEPSAAIAIAQLPPETTTTGGLEVTAAGVLEATGGVLELAGGEELAGGALDCAFGGAAGAIRRCDGELCEAALRALVVGLALTPVVRLALALLNPAAPAVLRLEAWLRGVWAITSASTAVAITAAAVSERFTRVRRRRAASRAC